MNWKAILQSLVDDTQEFDTDEYINAPDFLDWFAVRREEIKEALAQDEADERWHNA